MIWFAAFQVGQIIVLIDHLYLLSDRLTNDVVPNEDAEW
jgi:hypothetical protein